MKGEHFSLISRLALLVKEGVAYAITPDIRAGNHPAMSRI